MKVDNKKLLNRLNEYIGLFKRIITKNRLVPHLIVLVFFMIFTGAMAVRLGQDVSYDLHNYHFNNPHSLFEGKIEKNIAVSGVLTYENPLRDIPAYILMTNMSPKKAGFFIGAVQGINIWLIFEILLISLTYFRIRRLHRWALALLISFLTIYGSGFNSELGTVMGDNTTSVFVLASILLFMYYVNSKTKNVKLEAIRLLSFILMGVSAGLKLTNLAFVIGIFIVSILISCKEKIVNLKTISLDALAIVVGVFISGGIWFIKMYIIFKNPIFPFYNGIFKSEYYPEENFVDTRWTDSSVWQSLIEPFYYLEHQYISSEVGFRDPRLAVMFIIIILTFINFIYKKFKTDKSYKFPNSYLVLVLFTIVSYVAWAVQFSYYRYIIPIELLSLVIITFGIFLLIKKTWIATLISVATLLLINLYTIQTSWGRVVWQNTNFGLSSDVFKELDNSVVIIAGYQPYSFMIPYIPSSSQVIRVESDLSSPSKGSESMQSLIRESIKEKSDREFYLLVADEDKKTARKAVSLYGFSFKEECEEVPVTIRHGSKNKYRLCVLSKTE